MNWKALTRYIPKEQHKKLARGQTKNISEKD